jgi:hypothetical protein
MAATVSAILSSCSETNHESTTTESTTTTAATTAPVDTSMQKVMIIDSTGAVIDSKQVKK